MSGYERLIGEARQRLNLGEDSSPVEQGGEEVQLSVRLPVGLRDAANDLARRRGQTLTGLVTELLVTALDATRDPFAALAVDLAELTRQELAAAIAAGDYGEAAAQIDMEDGLGIPG